MSDDQKEQEVPFPERYIGFRTLGYVPTAKNQALVDKAAGRFLQKHQTNYLKEQIHEAVDQPIDELLWLPQNVLNE